MLLPHISFALGALSLASCASASGISQVSKKDTHHGDFLGVCKTIASSVSGSSQIFDPNTPQYVADNDHAFISSSDSSACSVEPGSTEDVAVILQILGRTRTPFAIKSAGHATNPHFSSTQGVQVSLSRLNQLKVNAEAGTIEVGPGLTWDDVYQQLDPFNVTVIGGRIPGVGVGGLLLGGGYSFKSNQYGLGIDNIVAYEFVLPNGTIKTVTESDQDLWFALRGGGNNFGVVTKYILKSHGQGEVWGGLAVYGPDQLEAVKNAVAKFKIDLIQKLLLSLCSPTRLGSIPTLQQDVVTKSYGTFVKGLASPVIASGVRGFYCGFAATQYSSNFFDDIVNQLLHWGAQLTALDNNVLLSAGLEPFVSSVLSHGPPSAYPPDRSHPVFPSVLSLTWSNSTLDGIMAHSIREVADNLHAAALEDGQDVKNGMIYPNYALFDTPLKDMYGDNVERLQKLRRIIDPEDVMGLAGGFKF
ncbi:hypothetical protein B0F90DRAFT_1825825 [Multifurca ochricompacta]|uniref:FAD-binding PCMH-type domain-containing protein n=1 Tax=Multifurca ochricompacta TaxID=376703 RepID=A0AAD4LUJ0_9AGAM|nr:hypothetical protein B0F90DRAFT_1825825 [Multifurca ochricompacta]